MNSANAYNTYKNNSVNYASKEQLLLMLVDGAVKFAKYAKEALEKNDVKEVHKYLVKTQDIFYELLVTLQVDKAGNWGKDLKRVYEFIIERLREANFKKDIKILEEVLPLINEIHDIWHEAYKLSKSTNQL